MRRWTTAMLLAAVAVGTAGQVAQADTVSRSVQVGGTGTTLSLAAGQDGEVAFAGRSGQSVTVSTSGGTFRDPCDLQVSVRTAAGAQVVAPVCGGTAVTLPATALTSTMYAVVLDAAPTASGSVKVAVAGQGPRTLTPGAPTLAVTVAAGRSVQLGVPVLRGQYLWTAYRARAAADGLSLRVLSVDGSILAADDAVGTTKKGLRGQQPGDGLVRVVLANPSSAAATFEVSALVARDVTGTLVPATASTVRTTVKGQQVVLGIDVPAGSAPRVTIPDTTGLPRDTALRLLSPNGTFVDTAVVARLQAGRPITLDAGGAAVPAGRWSLVVDPARADVMTAPVDVLLTLDPR